MISVVYGFLPSSTNITGGALVKIVHYLMSPGQNLYVVVRSQK